MSVDKLAGRPNILGDESRRLTISLTKEQADYMRSQAEGSHVTISARASASTCSSRTRRCR